MWASQNEGYRFGGPYDKDHNILGVYWGPLISKLAQFPCSSANSRLGSCTVDDGNAAQTTTT